MEELMRTEGVALFSSCPRKLQPEAAKIYNLSSMYHIATSEQLPERKESKPLTSIIPVELHFPGIKKGIGLPGPRSLSVRETITRSIPSYVITAVLGDFKVHLHLPSHNLQ